MKTYSSVSITMVILIILFLLAGLLLKSDTIYTSFILYMFLIFVVDTVFMIKERKKVKRSEKFIFPLTDFDTRKYVYYIMIIISITIMAYLYIKNGFESPSYVLIIAFLLVGIRGLIFGSQTLDAIRIDKEYIEYGYGFFDHTKIKLIKSYTIDYDNKILILRKENKDIRIKIKYLKDIASLDEVLRKIIRETPE